MTDAKSNTGDETTNAVKLETIGLTRRFGELVANEKIDLGIREGELRAIIGPNGAGKTTLFNMIAGTLSPSEGNVRYEGADIIHLPPEDRAQRGLARSYQSNQLFFDVTVLENVRLAAQAAELGSFAFSLFSRAESFQLERAEEIIELVGLEDVRTTHAKNLSHGDQRKLGIAVALATNPETLLLDEPTSGMGSAETDQTAALIERIHKQLDLTVLLIEHDMSVVLSISDRISVLHRGSLLATGTPQEIRENQDVQEAYLGGLREEEIR
ncbi:ABC transporter ATP-binding protein [Haladaptatus halobius]|uniref:ABC transporter ATP-binding protein n=1 Tax=Haladaptatus halobius TaxID=2884875 RepID=UPI001D09DDA6|nr:ABC transporter ATP-binding protein [Haladaptatus halobius]